MAQKFGSYYNSRGQQVTLCDIFFNDYTQADPRGEKYQGWLEVVVHDREKVSRKRHLHRSESESGVRKQH